MEGVISISVRELCEKMLPSGNIDMRRDAFRVIESIRLHSILQKRGGDVYAPEVGLKKLFDIENESIMLTGRADGIIQTEDGYFIDEIKCVNVPVAQIERDTCPTHLAQAMCYGYMFASDKGLDNITVRLTYCDISTEETVKFDYFYETDDLCVFVENMLTEYIGIEHERLKRRKSFQKSAKRLAFPYEDYRDGQRSFCEYALEAICTKKKLFAEAPTGIGKTMSALFPAVKASGNGYGEKIFYFTSKTTIAEAAKDAFVLMREKGLDASCIVITARERLCAHSPDSCDPTVCQNACGHYDRINDALSDALENDRVFDRKTVDKYAKKHSVCPYELSLAISEWCELVICDYNYLFDPIVFFRRYFINGGDYIFLVDEAHNLGDRARSMYSHSVKSRDIELLLMSHSTSDKILYPKLYEVLEYMKSADRLVDVKKRRSGDMGSFKSEKPFGILNRKLAELIEAFDAYFRVRKDIPQQMSDIYFEIKKYLKISEYYDEKYVSLIEYRNGDYTFRQLCVDPSSVIKSRFELGRCAILFSATLSPAEYYKSILGGCDHDITLTLDSPFPKENLCLCTTYKFSTRLDDRKATLASLTGLLETFVKGKKGNYIAFFPSYKYMSEVHAEFIKRFPGVKTIVQRSDMTEKEREDYIHSFEADAGISEDVSKASTVPEKKADPIAELFGGSLMRGASFFANSMPKTEENTEEESEDIDDTMLAFGVLGGVFSEGIDFAGERLIGCAIIGVGLPGINDDSNIICEYYNSRSDDEYMRGYDYAYRIPGMIKVLQAAGRVIRSENDRGAVLLIDDRYATREYASMYPAHWKQMKLVGDRNALAELLRRFWNKE
ncbi:MAG: ATP-dependent DNA helicase [Clostridia bacterium]|nr:ATP-dependent DNA helicase [Clostridia bacterium]